LGRDWLAGNTAGLSDTLLTTQGWTGMRGLAISQGEQVTMVYDSNDSLDRLSQEG
jgi:hypothetical protein